MNSNIEHVKQALLEALNKDQLVLPTLPEIALKVREAANDPNIDIKRLNSLIGSDAALSARIIKVANSPLVRSKQTIENLPAALSRLGITYSCNLAMGLAMEQMFQATNEMIDRRMRETWARSAEVAAIANVLAQSYTKLQADQATLAGLTHLIGVLPILTYIEEQGILLDPDQSEQLDDLIANLSPQLGESILRTWSFPEAIVKVPSQHSNYQRDCAEVDYVDVVIVAKLQSYGSESPDTELSWEQIPAFAKLGLAESEESLELSDLDLDMTTNALL
ncbi:MAG: histidine kinase [SAR86 cluster bacterium]|uniref:Histidine kinase n=1 Tax=SAR86 cluster bacterium TaxID=2030880 RepID=A0A2A4MEF8_9GAMM|nr:MAG: histidine kinase [SAR86 cluster bacterium]